MTSRGIPLPPPCPPAIVSQTNHHVPTLNFMSYVKQFMETEVKDPALHEAAFHGDTRILKGLLRKKDGSKHLNQRNHLGCTPLRLAASGGHADCVRVLLSYGAAPDLSDIKAQTPLATAVKFKKTDCVKMLLEAGADPDGDVNNLSTPLCWAVQLGHYDNVQLLLDHGCDVDGVHSLANHPATHTPLHTTITYGHKSSFVALLHSGAMSPGSRDESLYEVAMVKHSTDPDWVQQLYDHGVPLIMDRETTRILTSLALKPACVLFQSLFCEPRSLISLSRISIQCHLKKNRRLKSVPELPLPAPLVRYLLYQGG